MIFGAVNLNMMVIQKDSTYSVYVMTYFHTNKIKDLMRSFIYQQYYLTETKLKRAFPKNNLSFYE